MRRNNPKPPPPRFKSVHEASDFWDEHSLLEFDGTKEAQVSVDLKRRHYIGLDREVFKKLNVLARRQKMTPEELVVSWVRDRSKR